MGGRGGTRRGRVVVLVALGLAVVAAGTGTQAGGSPVAEAWRAPTTVRALPRHEGADVRWTPPRYARDDASVHYRVKASPGPAGCTSVGTNHCVVTGLLDGDAYTFTVRAETPSGWGPRSAPSDPVIPRYVIDDAVRGVSRERMATLLEELAVERRTVEQRAAARTLIKGELIEAGYAPVDDPFSPGGVNVLARLEGTNPTAGTVVLGAHYDTVTGSPGADDNGSGTVAVIEIARALAEMSPRRSIEFVFFDLEEIGLQGSEHYVAADVAGTPVVAAVIMDMIGYSCAEPGCQLPIPDLPTCLDVEPEGVNVGLAIAAAADEQSYWVLDRFADMADRHVPDLEYGTGRLTGTGTCLPSARRSDHVAFWDGGLPAIILSDTAEFRNPNYHSANDTFATVDLTFMTRVARGAAATVARLARI